MQGWEIESNWKKGLIREGEVRLRVYSVFRIRKWGGEDEAEALFTGSDL